MTMFDFREAYSHLIILFTLHCLGDYPLQGDFLANMKAKNPFLLIVHSFLWSGLIYAGFYFLGLTNNPSVFGFNFALHTMIDRWKCDRPDKSKALTTDLYIDQALHAVQILITYILVRVW